MGRRRKSLFPAASLHHQFNTQSQSIGIRHAIGQAFKVTDYVHENSSAVERSSTSQLDKLTNEQLLAKQASSAFSYGFEPQMSSQRPKATSQLSQYPETNRISFAKEFIANFQKPKATFATTAY